MRGTPAISGVHARTWNWDALRVLRSDMHVMARRLDRVARLLPIVGPQQDLTPAPATPQGSAFHLRLLP